MSRRHRSSRAVALAASIFALVLGTAIVGAPMAEAGSGCDGTTGLDVNGDGIDDLATGVPNFDSNHVIGDTVVPADDTGAVYVFLGEADGTVSHAPARVFLEESHGGPVIGVGGANESGDHFGATLAVGDVDNDGCADLAIGVPGEDSGAGRVVVVFGSPTGMDGTRSRSINQDAPGVPSTTEAGDSFGAALAFVGHSGGLWVGSPGEDVGSVADAGAITELPAFSDAALPTTGIVQFFQGHGGVPGAAEAGDRFGSVLSGTGQGLAVGVPREDVGHLVNAGAVFSFGTAWTEITQSSPGVPGVAETGDAFGSSVAPIASCDPTPGAQAWVVGSPNEDVGTVTDAGTVTVIDPSAGTWLLLSQGADPVFGKREAGDHFGARVATSGAVVVAASSGEDVGTVADAGTIYQAATSCTGNAVTVTQHSTLAMPGTTEAGARFGLGLAFAQPGSDSTGTMLLVGAPYKDVLVQDGDFCAHLHRPVGCSWYDAGGVFLLSTRSGALFSEIGAEALGSDDVVDLIHHADDDHLGAVLAGSLP